MTLYHLSKLIYRLYVEGELRKRFREDPGAILDRFDLTEEEKRIVIEKDYVALYGLGVHPMLVAHYVSVTGGERSLTICVDHRLGHGWPDPQGERKW